MKLMFASDIHGSAESCKLMLKRFDEEKAGCLFLLGDILYHGPRNEPPEGYDPKAVARMLNARKDILFCVKGNCDSEVDQMMLEFPIMAEYALLYLNGRSVFLTHGHKFNMDSMETMKVRDILIHGHTHIQTIQRSEDLVYINPGSVSLPKNGKQKSYMTYEKDTFIIKSLEDRSHEMEYKNYSY